MFKKIHPILTVLIILGVVVLVFGLMMTLIGAFFGSAGYLSFAQRIGVIEINGVINESNKILNQLVDFRKDGRIKAIIVRIDSPGGGVGPSQEIYQEIRKTVKKKKVIASLGGMAASGAYYVAAAADKIVANPGTIVGSIGVIMEFIQAKDLMDKIGIGLEIVKSGEFKDMGSPHRQMTEHERKVLMEGLIRDTQDQFVQDVARGRRLDVEKVREIADGRVLSGARAKGLGLVDVLGNFQDAVDVAKRTAGIDGEVTLVYPKQKKVGLLDFLLKDAADTLYRSLSESVRPRMQYRWEGFPPVQN